MASEASSAAAWRASELQRRVENRRRAAQSLLLPASVISNGADHAWTTTPTLSVLPTTSRVSPLPSPTPSLRASVKTAGLSSSSLSMTASLEPPLTIAIPSSPPRSTEAHSTPLLSCVGQRTPSTTLATSLSLPQLWRAKQDVLDTHMGVVDLQAKHAASVRACDQQFLNERSVRQLKSGISTAQLTIRAKQDELDALQRRVLRLSQTLQATASSSDTMHFASHRIAQLDAIRKDQSVMRQCATCGKAFVQHVLAAHEAACSDRKAREQELPTTSTNQIADAMHEHQRLTNADTSIAAPLKLQPLPRFVAQPPRNLRIADAATSVTHSAVLLQWDSPIFTGSTPIIDYELRFSVVTTTTARVLDASGDVVTTLKRTLEPLPPQTTSRWCLQVPVAPNAYWVRDLDANCEYGDFTLCAITKHGTSALSNTVALIKTAPAMPPTAPYFLTLGAVTASTISLGWQAPLDDGGAAIESYEIVFTEAVLEDTVQDTRTDKHTFLDTSVVVYKPRRVRTPSSATTHTLVDLLSGQEHKDFHVRAINSAGIPGAFSTSVASVFTIAPGNAHKLLDELQAAVNSRARVVDSQFLSGFMQRYDRSQYIHQVSRFIVAHHPELADKVDAILQRTDMALSDAQEASEHDASSPTATTQRRRFDDLSPAEQVHERRRQFHFRIADLSHRLEDAAYNVRWSLDRRIALVALIRAAEARILEKQAELERAKMFRGPQMDSDVLESGLQRFYTKDLVWALEDELAIEQLYIVDAKSEIVQVENYLRADERKHAALTQRLADRRAALDTFERALVSSGAAAETDATETDRHNVRVASLARLRQGVLYRAFSALAANRTAAHVQRRKVRATLARLVTYHTRMAFRHWVTVVRTVLRRADADGTSSSAFGVGSLGLVNASLERDELLLQSHALLLELRSADTNLQRMVWTREQQQQQQNSTAPTRLDSVETTPEKVFSAGKDAKCEALLLEADAKMGIRDFDGARHLYELVLNTSAHVERLAPPQLLKLQLQLGRAHLELQSVEHALTFLNRASFLATRLGQRADEGDATLLLGRAHTALRSLRLAIEHYERALLCFEAVSDVRGQVASLRGLQTVYATLEDAEMVASAKQQADDLEFALTQSLTRASDALERMQQRLVGVGAESSTEIVLERVGAIVPRLRTQRIQRKLDMSDDAKLVASLETLLAEKRALLAQGEVDLKRALASDSLQVDSSVLSGSSARYEIEDFKTKLAKLMGSIHAGEALVAKEIANARIRIRNCEDEIGDLEQELQVETGDLMRQMMARAPLRCFCFNATNAALQCVVGTASHGVSTCVASAEHTGLLVDLLTGACLGQAVGDPHRQHLGPPRGHQAQIVALYYVGTRIYTGGMDAALGVWDVQDAAIGGGFGVTLVQMLLDFDAAVVSVVADLALVVCGCADCDVFVFDAASLAVVARVIGAHDRSALALAVDSTREWFVTGSADARVSVWELGARSPHTTYRRVTKRHCLGGSGTGHAHTVTCVKQVASEVVSGDTNGRVVIWNLDADSPSKLLRVCDVHAGVPMQCLQFDATRVVSGAQDGRICVTDFATGQLLQTLVGHRASVLDLQFDRQRLVSMSADGRVRLWYWQGRIGVNASTRKYHILSAGETLKALSLKYHASIRELLAWNRLPDSSKLYVGQKLVVGVDARNSVAADELATLDMAVSRTFGKVSAENLAFAAANRVKSMDVEAQRASRKQALLAKAYFPSLDDDEEDGGKDSKSDADDGDVSESDTSDDADIPVGSDNDPDAAT